MKLIIKVILLLTMSSNIIGQNTDKKVDINLIKQLKKDYFYCESYDTSKYLAQMYIDKRFETSKYIVEKIKLDPIPRLVNFPIINCDNALILIYLFDTERLKGVIDLTLINDTGLIYDEYRIDWIKYNLLKKKKIISGIGEYNGKNIIIYNYKRFLQKVKMHPYYTKIRSEKALKIDTVKNVFVK